MKSVLVAVVVLSGFGAARAEGLTVALHPPVVADAVAGQSREIELAVDSALDAQGVSRTDGARVAKFLRGQAGGRCTADTDACLVELARYVGAPATLFVNVTLYPVRVSGRLVGADGAVLWAPETVTGGANDKRMEGVKRAVGQLLAKLPKSIEVKTVRKPAVAAGAPAAEESLAVELPPASGGSGLAGLSEPPLMAVGGPAQVERTEARPARSIRMAPWVLGGAGVLAVVGGVAFEVAAASAARQFTAVDLGAGGPASNGAIEQLRTLQRQHSVQQAAGTLLLGAGGAAVVGSVVWMYLDRRSEGQVVTGLWVSPGGVGVTGVWR